MALGYAPASTTATPTPAAESAQITVATHAISCASSMSVFHIAELPSSTTAERTVALAPRSSPNRLVHSACVCGARLRTRKHDRDTYARS